MLNLVIVVVGMMMELNFSVALRLLPLSKWHTAIKGSANTLAKKNPRMTNLVRITQSGNKWIVLSGQGKNASWR